MRTTLTVFLLLIVLVVGSVSALLAAPQAVPISLRPAFAWLTNMQTELSGQLVVLRQRFSSQPNQGSDRSDLAMQSESARTLAAQREALAQVTIERAQIAPVTASGNGQLDASAASTPSEPNQEPSATKPPKPATAQPFSNAAIVALADADDVIAQADFAISQADAALAKAQGVSSGVPSASSASTSARERSEQPSIQTSLSRPLDQPLRRADPLSQTVSRPVAADRIAAIQASSQQAISPQAPQAPSARISGEQTPLIEAPLIQAPLVLAEGQQARLPRAGSEQALVRPQRTRDNSVQRAPAGSKPVAPMTGRAVASGSVLTGASVALAQTSRPLVALAADQVGRQAVVGRQAAPDRPVSSEAASSRFNRITATAPSYEPGTGIPGSGSPGTDLLPSGTARLLAANKPFGSVMNRVAPIVIPPDGPLPSKPVTQAGRQQQMTISNFLSGQTVAFRVGSDELTQEGQRVLASLLKIIQLNRSSIITIQGHTDNIGDDSSNLQLSTARSIRAREYLIARGVSSARLQVQGFGERRPLADNQTIAGRILNRRIDFAVSDR